MGGGAELAAAVDIAMLAGHRLGEFPAGGADPQAIAQRPRELDAALLVADVARQPVGGVVPLPRSWHRQA